MYQTQIKHQTLATFLCHHILRKKGFIALVPGRVQALNSVPQWNKNLLSVIVVCELVGRGRDAVRLRGGGSDRGFDSFSKQTIFVANDTVPLVTFYS